MVLMDFIKPLSIVTDLQYAERVVFDIEISEFVQDDTKLAF